MKLEWLHYFDEIAKAGSMTKAADKLYLSQPAITKIIHNIEKEIDEVLFLRKSTGVTLTEQGELFWEFARSVIESETNYLAKKEFTSSIVNQSGSIELAISPILLQVYYNDILEHLKKIFPHKKIIFIEAKPDAILDLIKDQKDIVGLSMFHPATMKESLAALNLLGHYEVIAKTPLVLCMAKNSIWSKTQNLSQSDIPPQNLIIFEEGKNPKFEYNKKFDFDFYSMNLEIIKNHLISENRLCVSLPRFAAQKYLSNYEITFTTPTDCDFATTYFIYSNEALHIYSKAFLQRFSKELKNILDP